MLVIYYSQNVDYEQLEEIQVQMERFQCRDLRIFPPTLRRPAKCFQTCNTQDSDQQPADG